MPHESLSDTSPRLLPWIVFCAVLAVVIDLGRFHIHHHGDTLVPVLCSLYYWTPFYWEQDRLGSLLPLLALPARNPLVNLLVQSGLGIFFSLLSFFLLPRFVLRDRTWPIVGSLGLTGFLLFTPEFYRFTFMAGHQPYFTSLALGLGGLIATERAGARRFAIGLVLLLLAHWVHLGAFTILLPLAVARAGFMTPVFSDSSAPNLWLHIRDSEVGRQFGLLCVSTLAGIALTRLSPYHHPGSGFGFMSPAYWISSWSQMSANAWDVFQQQPGISWPDFLLGLAGIGLLWTCFCGERARSRLLRATLVFLCAGAGNAMVTGSTHWVRINQLDPRYWTATITVFQAALITIAVHPLLSNWSPKANQLLGFAFVPVLLGATMAMYGLPSISAVRRDLDQSLASQTPDIIASQTTHVMGDYWDVWPAVYHANWTLYERGSMHRVWGITTRSHPTRKIWIRCPAEQMRIALVLQPSRPDLVEENYRLGLRYLNDSKSLIEVQRLSTIRILRPMIDSD